MPRVAMPPVQQELLGIGTPPRGAGDHGRPFFSFVFRLEEKPRPVGFGFGSEGAGRCCKITRPLGSVSVCRFVRGLSEVVV